MKTEDGRSGKGLSIPPSSDAPSSILHPQKQWWPALLGLLLFCGALALRMWALGWGLPYVEHGDEAALLEVAIRIAHDGDLNPHRFLYPSLFYYLLLAAIELHAWWGIGHGLYTSVRDIPIKNNIITSVPELFIWTRAVTALLGAAAVPALFALGRRMFDLRAGLLAGLALMVATFHVEHSHYVTTDAPTSVWVVLAALGAWEVAQRGTWRGYILGGVATGLAAGTKYNAAVVALALVLAHILHWRRAGLGRPFLRLVSSGALSALAFLATTPYALLDWSSFIDGLRFNSAHYAAGGHGDFVGSWQVGEYSLFVWEKALFIPGSLLALAGLPLLARRYPRQAALLLTIILVEMLLLLSYKVNFVRNILPIYPLLILLPAAGAAALADLAPRPILRRLLFAVLGIALLVPYVQDTLWLLNYWSKPYTMVAAATTMHELPRGMRMAGEVPSTLVHDDPIIFPVKQITEHTLEWYRANGYRYLVANDDLRTPEDQAAYERIKAAAQVLVEYPRRRLGLQPGPSGAILDLGVHLDEMPFVRHEMRFGEQIELLGYEIQPGELRSRVSALEGADLRELQPGQPLQINLYWRGLVAIDHDYTLFVHVIDARGEKVAQRDLPLRYGEYPTSRWQPGELVIDRADMPLPVLPQGEYRLEIGLYDGETGAGLGLPVPAGGGAPDTTLTTVRVK